MTNISVKQSNDLALSEKVKRLHRLPRNSAFLKVDKSTNAQEEKLIGLKTCNGIHILKEEEILHCQAQGNYCEIICLSGKKVLISKTLKDVEEKLTPSRFLRTHMSHLVAINSVRFLGKSSLELEDGTKVPIARSSKSYAYDRITSSVNIV